MSNLCYDKAVLEMCRDLVMRAHGKFSFGSEFKPHRFAVEIKPSEDSVEFRVWELERPGYGYDFCTCDGSRIRTVVRISDFMKSNIPSFASCYPEVLKRLQTIDPMPTFIRCLVKLDFEGRIWGAPKVYVRDITLSSKSLVGLCEDEERGYVEGIFNPCFFKEFSGMRR